MSITPCLNCRENGVTGCGDTQCPIADPSMRWEAQKTENPCHACWVRLGGRKRPCQCDNIRQGTPWDQYQCAFCWNYHHDEAYNLKWGGDGRVIQVDNQAMPCVHLGTETGEKVGCGSCQGHVEVKLRSCRIHGKCSTHKKLTGVASCPGCNEFKAKTVIQLHVTAGGIGDHVLGLTASEGLKRDHPDSEVIYACHDPSKVNWVKLFTGYDRVVEKPWRGVLTYRPHDSYSRNSKLQERTRWEHYAHVCGTTPILPEIKPLPESITHWAESYSGMIALAPWSVYQERTWPLDHWLKLEELLIGAGYNCVILDDREERNKDFVSEVLAGKSPQEVAAVLLACSCLVGNDSGIPHVGGMLRSKVLVLSSKIDGGPIFGIYPGVRVITTPHEGGSLGDISPDAVFNAVGVVISNVDTVAKKTELELHPHHPDERAHLFSATDGGSAEIETREILSALVRSFKPELVLETGTYLGKLTQALAAACVKNGFGRVITLECDHTRADAAKKALAGLPVQVIEAFAENWLLSYNGPQFGLIVLDTETYLRAKELQIIRDRGLAMGPVFIHDTSRLRKKYYDEKTDMPAEIDTLNLPGIENPYARGWRLLDLGKHKG